MPSLIDLLLQGLTFGAVFLLVLAGERAVGASLAVRRRLGPDSVASTQPMASVIKSDTVRNRFLVWVQSATLTDSKDRNKLRRDLSLAGFDHPAAPATYVAIRLALAIGAPVALIMWGSLTGKAPQQESNGKPEAQAARAPQQTGMGFDRPATDTARQRLEERQKAPQEARARAKQQQESKDGAAPAAGDKPDRKSVV